MSDEWLSLALRMLAFAGFMALALLVRKGDRPGASTPLAALIVYAIAVSTFVGFSGKDMWPFAAWRYVSYAVGQQGEFLKLVGVDGNGNEQPLDTRTFEPLEFAALMGDLDLAIARDAPAHRDELLGFLLKLAQAGLMDAHAGKPVGRFRRLLGPFSAPVFHVAVTPWSDPKQLPDRIDALRAYRVQWRISDDIARVEKQVLVAGTKP